ncbi:sugar transferase [Blastococcus sp. VKM Ac-2987]|uniref:sugar transferase n=1 Tax=Blastococcus sp. VKM Ac-2987 TaxID=3004141 RepID=UPI0022AB7DBE|nr:sugar transferase [Blastococcus sp. VKM Ac-2987]MCZ2858487.1 sugar transferase [Blastococcus sp. VKM Ac-2987]
MIDSSEQFTADDGKSAHGSGSRPEDARAVRREKTPLRSVDVLPQDVHAPHGPSEDADPCEVRRLEQLRPVPPVTRPPAASPPRTRPVYDPFTARRRRPPEWLVTYVATLVIGDTLATGVAVWLAAAVPGPGAAPQGAAALAFVLAWPLLHLLLGSYTERRFGSGPDEFRRVVLVGVLAMSLCGLIGTLPWESGSDRLILVGAPVAGVLSLVGHGVARWRLHVARRGNLKTKQVVLVGRDVAVLDLARRIRRDPCAGLDVVGVCVPQPDAAEELRQHGLSVLGRLDEVTKVLDDVRADAVVVTSASETAGAYLRELSWRLEGTNIEVLVCPGLIEVAPNRLQVRPMTSLPLIQVREPDFRGSRRLVKAVLDRTAAAVLLIVATPLMLGITIAIRATSPGPAIYRHRRVGKRGRHFDLLKFRSMAVGADQQVDALWLLNEGNEVQFKLRRDPRVTRVGHVLRRSSLDELPQLINVLKGEMSFVGPRPHVDREVEHYGPDMHRRLLVKPGITGLWQVSGRSDLSWEQAVELDVRYVENWSLGLDLTILWRTLRAVTRSCGAY